MADSPWDMLSAIGTMTAVVVALGVSGHAAWVTRRADKDRSELVAAKMLSPITVLERKASYLFAWFCFNDVEPADGHMNILRAIQELDVLAGAISIDDLYPLLHLKSHAAKRAARALGLIQSFSSDATAMLAHHSWSNVALRETHHKRWAVMLSDIKDHLAIAVLACEVAASTGAPRPTTEEIMRP
ncbi:hypothetical protein [Pseudomonas brassicacearum]|uniref:Uncharacterized protein n=1 Tax=Pseudomonas brassicacearum TaxID=930166 RepID=A0A423GP25_9PSED|nr:hypothetical protein [Pseudomonas brassicacearum]ROM94429.1 hypothetical protein BK658_17910 [Pseudomonas brassicacearum]